MIFAHVIQTASSLPTDASALKSSISALEIAISALESDIATLERSSIPWEHWAWFFTFLVLLGVLLELWVIRHEWRDDWEAWAIWDFVGIARFPNIPLISKLVVEVASVLLIGIGIAGELSTGIKIARINGDVRSKSAELRSKGDELRSDSDQLLALVTAEAGEAKDSSLIAKASAKAAGIAAGNAQQKAVGAAEQAGTAKADAAKAQGSAVIAGNMAMEERFEREQMEYFSLPRKLDDFRRAEYLAKLRTYTGTKFFVVTLTDTEPVRLGRRIEALLHDAGWEKEPMIRYSEADEHMIPDGISVESNGPIVGPPPSPLLPAMEALTDILTNSKMEATKSFLNPWLPPDKLPPNTLRIVIGLKPDTYFDIKLRQKEAEERRR